MSRVFFGCKLPSDFDADDETEHLGTLEVLRPKATHLPLIRIGGNRDGAYLLPDDLEGIEACFSPGVNNFKTFEDTLAEEYGIASHMCDFTSVVEAFRTPLRDGLQTFEKVWLDLKGVPDSVTLEDWVARRAPGTGDLILQMDIEGAEYRNILAAPREVLQRFRIILLELHALNRLADPATFHGALKPFLEALDRDFVCVHAHPNNSLPPAILTRDQIEVPPILEVTFLRRDRLDPDKTQLPVRLPHPLDIQLNVQTRPPVFLDDWWRGRPPDAGEVALMLAAQTNYLRQNLTSLQRAADGFETWRSLMTEAFTAMHKQSRDSRETASPNLSDLEEVASGKPYSLSSSRRSEPESGIIQAKKPFFFHTLHESRPQISIDLGEVRTIEWLRLGNRTDTGQARASGLFARFGLSEVDDGPILPLATPESFSARNPAPCLIELYGQKARFVTLIGTRSEPLHLSEIAVFAHPKPD